MRSPLTDPKTGDRLAVAGSAVEVTYDGHGTVTIKRWPKSKYPGQMSISEFRIRFQFAEVLHVAE